MLVTLLVVQIRFLCAGMAELVDARDLKSLARLGVRVRLPLPVLYYSFIRRHKLPKLSKNNINMFCRTAKVVFPVDKIFNLGDYYEAFILSSRARSVSFPTFRRYVNDLYLSGKFSGLERVRNNTHSPYMFFVDSSASSGSSRGMSLSPRKDNLSDVVLRQSAPPSYLEEFSVRLITLLTPGKKYRARSLYTKYRSEFSARIKFETFKKYVSSAVKAGFLLNFSRITNRRRGSSGGIFYETTSAFRGKNTPLMR